MMLTEDMLHFDADGFFEKLGGIGRFQVQTYAITQVIQMFSSFQYMIMAFVNIIPTFACTTNTDLAWDNNTGQPMSCYIGVSENYTKCGANGTRFIYDPSYGINVVSQWDLVCDNDYLAKLTGSFFMMGCFIGGLTVSTLSDRYGRRRTYMIATWLFTLFCGLTAAAPTLEAYSIFRFFTGVFSEGAGMVAWVLVTESICSANRSYLGILGGLAWVLAQIIVGALAYFIRDWRLLHAVVAMPMIITVSFYWLVPESLHWLLAKRKLSKAAEWVETIFKINKKSVGVSTDQCRLKKSPSGKDIVPVHRNILHAAKSPILLLHTLLLGYLWIVNVFVYYGLAFFIPKLTPRRYLNFFLAALVEVPAMMLTPFCVNWKLGNIGRFQIQTYLVTEIIVLTMAFQFMSMAFVNITPKFTCASATEPRHKILWQQMNKSSCLIPDTNITCESSNAGYVYDPSYGTNVVTEWNLVCNRDIFAKLSGSFFMIGCFVGALVVSTCSDRFGRRNTYLVSTWLFSLCCALTGSAPTLATYCLARLFTGAFCEGCGMTAWVLVTESISSSDRSFVAIVGGTCWTIGQLIVGAVAYFIRDWRMLHAVLAIPMLLTVSFYWLVPESLHWLLAKRKFNQAAEWVERTLAMNNTQASVAEKCRLKRSPSGKDIVPVHRNILHALKSPILTIHTALLAYIWIVNVFVYYGLAFFIPQLSARRFLNFFLSALVELPAMMFTPFLVNWFGRRATCAASHALAGVSLISLIFVPATAPSWIRSVLGLIGKYGITSSFNALFIWMTEIFPTTMRSSGCGFCSMVGRTGGIVMPYVALESMNRVIPPATFGALALGGAVASVMLPETRNQILPRDIQHVTPGPLAAIWFKTKSPQTVTKTQPFEIEKLNP